MLASAKAQQDSYVAQGGTTNLINVQIEIASGYATVGTSTAQQSAPGSASTMVAPVSSAPIPIWPYTTSPSYAALVTQASTPATTPASIPTSSTPVIALTANNSAATYGDSYFSNSFNTFYTNTLQSMTNGNGLTPTTPQNFVFIVTDGLDDHFNPYTCSTTNCMAAIDPSICTQIKSKATVGTIYTTYQTLYNKNDPKNGLDPIFQTYVQPYVGQIPTNMQSCASNASYYYEASDGPAITAGMNQLMANSAQQARLTQ